MLTPYSKNSVTNFAEPNLLSARVDVSLMEVMRSDLSRRVCVLWTCLWWRMMEAWRMDFGVDNVPAPDPMNPSMSNKSSDLLFGMCRLQMWQYCRGQLVLVRDEVGCLLEAGWPRYGLGGSGCRSTFCGRHFDIRDERLKSTSSECIARIHSTQCNDGPGPPVTPFALWTVR